MDIKFDSIDSRLKIETWKEYYGNAYLGNCIKCKITTINGNKCEYRRINTDITHVDKNILPLCIECANIYDKELQKNAMLLEQANLDVVWDDLILIYNEFRSYFEARVGLAEPYGSESAKLYGKYLRGMILFENKTVESLDKINDVLTEFHTSKVWTETYLAYEGIQLDILFSKWYRLLSKKERHMNRQVEKNTLKNKKV